MAHTLAPRPRKPAAGPLARPAAPAAAPAPPEPAPAAAELEAQPTAPPQPKRKGRPWQPRKVRPFAPPPVDLPGSAAELLGLELPALEGLQVACELRMAHLKGQRARLLLEPQANRQQLAEVAAESAELGGSLAAIHRRRTALRVASRKALGCIPERAEAVALAADRILWGGLHRAVMAQADRIQATAAQDLEA